METYACNLGQGGGWYRILNSRQPELHDEILSQKQMKSSGEMAQLIKHVIRKHKSLSLIPRASHENARCNSMHLYNPSLGKAETSGCLDVTGQPNLLSSRKSQRAYLKSKMACSWGRSSEANLWSSHIYIHVSIHTHMNMQIHSRIINKIYLKKFKVILCYKENLVTG